MEKIYLEKNRRKNSKGITLIALVVTIVVLLILAAISISTLYGDNGLIYKARESKENTEIGKEKEQIRLAVAAALNYNETPRLTEERLAEELTKNIGERNKDYTLVKEGDKFKITYVDSKRSYTVDADGKIEGPTNSDGGSGGIGEQSIGYFVKGPVYIFPGTTEEFEAWEREQYDDNMTETEQEQMVYEALKYWQGVDFSDPNDEILNKINEMYRYNGFSWILKETYGIEYMSGIAINEGYTIEQDGYQRGNVKEWMIAHKLVKPREYFMSKFNQKYTVSFNGETYEYNPSEKCAMFYIDQTNTYKATIIGEDGSRNETNVEIAASKIPYKIDSEGCLYASNTYGNYAGINSRKYSKIKNVILNDTYDGIEVKSLGRYMFTGSKELETIRLPNGLTSISEAFADCTKLKSISIPASVQFIDQGAFTNCAGLETVKFEEGLISIGQYAFSGCNKLKTVELPSTVENLDRAFVENEGLETVIFKEGINNIYDNAFRGCKNLKNIIIPSTVEYIGYSTFENCEALTSVNIPEGLKRLYGGCFYGCNNIRTVTLPSTLVELDSSILDSDSLETVTVNMTQSEAEERWGSNWVPSGVEIIYKK